MKKWLLSILMSVVMFTAFSVSAYAAPAIMADGNIFDAEYYAENNPDIVAVIGNDEAMLYAHYVNYGAAEGRLPYAPPTTNGKKVTTKGSTVAAKASTVTAPAKQGGAAQTTYVLNKNTKKFHIPTCSSVSDMKAKNRWDVTLTRQEVIDKGYVPCKRCNP